MLKASVRALTLLALTSSLFGASFSWTLTPASDVAPQGQPIVIYVDLVNQLTTTQTLEFTSWIFNLGTFSPYYSFQTDGFSTVSAVTLSPLESFTNPVGILEPLPFFVSSPAPVGSILDLGSSTVTYCTPGVSCFNALQTLTESSPFEVTVGPPPAPEPRTMLLTLVGLLALLRWRGRKFGAGLCH